MKKILLQMIKTIRNAIEMANSIALEKHQSKQLP